MQQCLDKDLENVVLKPTFNDINNIFELKDLARKKWDSIELWLVWIPMHTTLSQWCES
jgi:hypothetical protein